MRYILFLNRLNSISGGVERMVVNYANYLVSEDNKVDIITIEKKQGRPFYDLKSSVRYFGLGKVRLNEKSSFLDSLRRFKKLRILIKEISPDYILAFQFGPYKIATLSALLLGKKIIFMERNSPQRHRFVSEGSFIIRQFWLRFAYRIAVQFPEYKKYYSGYLQNRIIVSRNFTHCKSDLLPITSCRDIFFVGRYGFQKNTELVYEVFNYLAKQHPWINFHMVGDGIESHYTSRFDNLNLNKPSSNWIDLAQNSIVVLLSRFEGCPNVFLEAMSVGIPCFGLHGVDGIHSLLTDNRGFLSKSTGVVEIANDLYNYSQNYELQNTHRINAFNFVNDFHEKSYAVSSFIKELNEETKSITRSC